MKRWMNKLKRLLAMCLVVMLVVACQAPAALAEAISAVVDAGSMTVYSDAALTQRLGEIDKGKVVRVTAWSGGVARISYAGRTGYARISDMQSVDDVAQKALTVSGARAYAQPDTASKSISVRQGTRLYVLAAESGWAQVEKDGLVAYMRSADLVRADDSWNAEVTPEPATSTNVDGSQITLKVYEAVTKQSTPVYHAASAAAQSFATLKAGQAVTVQAYTADGWAYIELNGQFGYCRLDALERADAVTTPVPTATPEPTNTPAPSLEGAIKATVTVDSLLAYRSASVNAGRIGTLRRGQEVNVLKYNSTWAYIELNGQYGYVPVLGLTRSSDLTTTTPTPEPTATPASEATPAPVITPDEVIRAEISVSSVPVYELASTKSRLLGYLKRGREVNVLKYNSTWAYIELNGRYGYTSVRALKKVGTVEPSPTATASPDLSSAVKAVVADASVTVYREPSTASGRMGTLRQGTEVNALSASGGWVYIEYKGYYGYCSLSALKRSDSGLPGGYQQGGFSATVVDSGAKVYASASTGASSASIGLGASVQVYAYNEEWAVITVNNGYGYIPVKQLSRAEYATVNSDGSNMLTLAKALLAYGYYDAVPSSSYNSAAIAAIRRLQEACGLATDGVADQTLQRILYSGHAPASGMLATQLAKGAKGTSVSRLQARLYALGYLSKAGSLDGDYGSNTASAVGLFQSANGISATGTADTATLKVMYSTSAKGLPSGVKAADAGSSSSSSSSSSSTYLGSVPGGLASTTSDYASGMSGAEKLEYVIYVAQNQLGKPYVYGATGPSKYDCTGLTYYCFKQVGVTLQRSAYSQGYDNTYTKIEGTSSLRRGDLVYFNTISDSDQSDHAGIYLGNGYFIHASSGGGRVVVSNLNSGYYSRVYSWGRRVF